MQVVIYHNPRCSKSRQTLELLHKKGIQPETVEYLKTPPDAAELARIIGLLGLQPVDLLRKGEDEYKQLDLSNPAKTDQQIIEAMVKHPRLIERPIVLVDNERAALGRPPENILQLF